MKPSGVQRLLRHLDQVVVPRLARGFQRLAGSGRDRAGRLRRQSLTAAGLVLVTAVLLAAVWTTNRHHPPAGEVAAGETVRVGVVRGQSVPNYVAAARTELRGLVDARTRTTETYALVTLHSYLAPDRLTPILGGVSVSEVYARVPLPSVQSQIVRIPAFRIPEDVRTGMSRVADRRDAEAAEYVRLSDKLTTAEPAERALRDGYLSGAAAAVAEATAFRSECTCVFAAVVRAVPSALDQIAARPEVMAVDPAPEVRRLDLAVFQPPLPEPVGVPVVEQSSRPSAAPAPASPTMAAPSPASPSGLPGGGPSGDPSGSAPPPSASPTATVPSPEPGVPSPSGPAAG
jgi:hypothetical protein